jgi:hypothetical protein
VSKRRGLIIPLVLLGLVLIVIGVIYIADTASSLPSFFPGHQSATTSHHHVKHGIAALVLGAGCFVLAWFQTGPAAPRARTPA